MSTFRTFSSVVLLGLMSIGAAAGLGGCQTISNGAVQAVTIETTPSGAVVEVPGVGVYESPATVTLARNSSTSIWISKDGYVPQRVQLIAKLDADRATPRADIMSMLGSAVDMAAGGSWSLSPGEVKVTLKPRAGKAAPTEAVASKSDAVMAEPAPKMAAKEPVKQPTKETATASTAASAPGGTPTEKVPSKPTMTQAMAENLARLERLHASGQLTDEEFAALKALVQATGVLAGAPVNENVTAE